MKTVSTTIVCDGCGGGLEVCDSGFDEYRLVLTQEGIRNTSNCRYAVHRSRPLDCDKHFCCLRCLRAWIEGRPE